MIRRRGFLAGIGATALASLKVASPASANSANSIVEMTAQQLSAAIQTRAVSCVEVMSAFLNQIDRLNPTYNAVVARADSDQLLDQARVYDGLLAKGESLGWMHGFPIAIKDLAHAEGFVTSNGSPIFADSVATADSIHVARMKAAGGIVIGKSNVPEFGLGSQSYNSVYGVTRCAYDATKTAGGSSGGAAAGLALRMFPVADGSDMMGSLRNPGAFNNVIGFRPTPGIVPLGDNFQETLACNGPMGRTVSDTAQLLATMAGAHPDSPGTLPVDPTQYAQELGKDWQGARIGWLGDFNGYLATEPGLLELSEKALQGFVSIGAKVEAVTLNFDMAELWEVWLTYRHWMNRGRGLGFYNDPELRDKLKPELIWEVEGGANITGDQISDAIAARGRWYKALLAAFANYDALVWPTTQVFPFDADLNWPKEIAGRKMDTYHRWMETVIPGTLAGCPVINVPAGFNPAGLPAGLQVMTPRYQDFKALQFAYAYEQATGWNLNHPPAAVS